MSTPGGSGDVPPKKPTRERSSVTRARRHAEAQMEHAEKMHRLAMLRRRIELAQAGVRAYQQHKLTEAVRAFHSYLHILEDWKGVSEGKLSPSHFDVKTDVAELLLISGVYWDLAKLYDRTQGTAKKAEFMHYLEKYIAFSKGMPFDHVCKETMRKYITNSKAVHMAEFKHAYKLMGGKDSCFVATSLVDVCEIETLARLRRFRDMGLRRSHSGRNFVAWYYRRGPRMAAWIDRTPHIFRKSLGISLDWMSKRLDPLKKT